MVDMHLGDDEPLALQRLRDAVEQWRGVDTPVVRIMTPAVTRLPVDASLLMATEAMLEGGVGGAPVVDAAGITVGMISKTDLLQAWLDTSTDVADVRVGDIMVPYLLALAADAPVALAASLMAFEGVHRLVVLSKSHQMVGIVSTLDVLRWLAQLSDSCLQQHTQSRSPAT